MKPNVIEAREETFQMAVIERSRHVPVLVDFWAPWCGPCRMLTPVLESLAAEGGGDWLLAKVNSDENPNLAARYGVRGIPNVKLFKDGQVVDEFVGAMPKPAVKQFLGKWVADKTTKRVAGAEAQMLQGYTEQARETLARVLDEQPDHARARLAMARLELAENDPEAALESLEKLPPRGPHDGEAGALRARAHFAQVVQAMPDAGLAQAEDGEVTGEDLESRYYVGCGAAHAGDYDTAAEQFLHILMRDPDFRDGAAHQAMLDLFALLGEDDPRTADYRRRLSWLLFS